MKLDALTAISPVDGRYREKTESLSRYFSEYALIRYRIRVEIEYFIALCELPLPQLADFDHALFPKLRDLYLQFDESAASRVKEIERVTNHDVKAVEYYLKESLPLKIGGCRSLNNGASGTESAPQPSNLGGIMEFIHFGLTSQDINNTSVPLSLQEALTEAFIPMVEELLAVLSADAEQWKDVPMLSRTHGQPATPTRLGKEFSVYCYRLSQQLDVLRKIRLTAKFGGATGNLNAHHVAYPDIDWRAFADKFVADRLGLVREQFTTQISNYDVLAEVCDAISRINTILVDLCRDIWMYISLDYFKQQIKAGEVGSSAMPHKVNPIDFENAEGNLGLANAVLRFLAQKLPVSRLQRDLTDSTVLRNIGVPVAHSVIAYSSILKGLGKLILNEQRLRDDLDQNWAVVAEAIQTILRREGYPQPYETLKSLTRTNEHITAAAISAFIDTLQVSEAVRKELHAITPANYTGVDIQ